MREGGLAQAPLVLFLSAALQVILKLVLRIKLCSTNGALVGLTRFMFFCHVLHLLSNSLATFSFGLRMTLVRSSSLFRKVSYSLDT